ncbi:MAG TPA: exodeoxyribonuclease V subunit beta [Gemmatimonadales bacterium]
MSRFDATRPLAPGVTLLEASAGTGKTYSITSIALQLVVEHGLDIGELLVVTFTEAATAELRDRVRGRLGHALGAFESAGAGDTEPAEDRYVAHLVQEAREDGTLERGIGRLRAALRGFDDAAIFTIHGFCSRVMREHAFECGADLDGELLEDAGRLLDDIVADFWARDVATLPEDSVGLLLAHGLSPSTLLGVARAAVGDPDLVIEPAPAPASRRDMSYGEILRRTVGIWRAERAAVIGAIDSLMATKAIDGRRWRASYLESRSLKLDSWVSGDEWASPPTEMGYFGVSSIRQCMKAGHDAPAHPFFEACDELIGAHAAGAGDMVLLLHRCAAYARQEFARRKGAARVHTYDDMLRRVGDALRDPVHGEALALALGRCWRAVLIDEFQDTDSVQWHIFSRAFGGGSHFLVLIGDPKQAIYSFRGADIHTYVAASRDAGARHELDTNWRSDAPLVEAVSHLFGGAERPFAVEGIDFLPVCARHGTRLRTGLDPAPLQVQLVGREGIFRPGDRTPGVPKRALEGHLPALVAADVARFLRSGTTIAEEEHPERPVTPRDVAVLVRTNRQAARMQRALLDHGVPAVLQSAESVFHAIEARELEAVLAAILEPARVRLARRALATELLGAAAAAELAESGAVDGEVGIGDALAATIADEARWERWTERFRAWRVTWEERGVMPMIRELLDECELPRRLLALRSGERRMTNLRHLAELLHDASLAESLAPPALLQWLRRRRADASSPGEAQQLRLESDTDAVRVVTIHKSKGLEYPVVWCPFLWADRLPDDRGFLRHQRERDGRRERVLDVGSAKAAREEALEGARDEAYAENLRLLYVALTRARHRCTVVWGGINQAGASALAHLLHVQAGDDVRAVRAAVSEQYAQFGDEALFESVANLAGGSGDTIAVRWMDVESLLDEPRWRAPESVAATPLHARRWERERPLDVLWRMGSFTALTRASYARPDDMIAQVDDTPEAVPAAVLEAVLEAVGDDRRAAVAQLLEVAGEPADSAVPLDDFDASARAGILFHDVLERLDFTDDAALEPLVRARLAAFGFDSIRWTEPVSEALAQVLATPLAAGSDAWRLMDVSGAHRMNELRFELPVCGGLEAGHAPALTPAALARVFGEHPGGALPEGYAGRLAALGFAPLRGFLSGAIDLVVERDGRWYVLDYKSNHLGPTRDHYAPHRLANEMTGAHYVLQYHLYLVALHRYLSWRVQGYDYERHVGGVLYLFLRGMSPEAGAERGVFHDLPPASRVLALDRIISGMEGGS